MGTRDYEVRQPAMDGVKVDSMVARRNTLRFRLMQMMFTWGSARLPLFVVAVQAASAPGHCLAPPQAG